MIEFKKPHDIAGPQPVAQRIKGRGNFLHGHTVAGVVHGN
jgi:hypothetical protein